MSKRGIEFYILDILVAIDKIRRYTAKFNSACALLYDELHWDATIRELEIIGEATKNLLHESVLHDKKYRRIVDFRNQINHGYFGIDEEIVWDVVKNKTDEYESDLLQLISELKLDMSDTIAICKQENAKQKHVVDFLKELERNINKTL